MKSMPLYRPAHNDFEVSFRCDECGAAETIWLHSKYTNDTPARWLEVTARFDNGYATNHFCSGACVGKYYREVMR